MTYRIYEPAQGILIIDTQGPGGQVQINDQVLVANGFAVQSGGASIGGVFQMGTHLVTSSLGIAPTPGVVMGAAGSTGSMSSFSGGDTAGRVFFVTGATPSQGQLVLVPFATAYATAPFVQIEPITPSLAAAQVYATASTNSFSVNVAVALPATSSQAFSYQVMG